MNAAITGATNFIKTGGNSSVTLNGPISDNGATPANILLTGNGVTATGTIGVGVLQLGSSASNFTGTISIERGRLQIAADAPATGPGSLGAGTSAVLLGTPRSNENENVELYLSNGVIVGRNIDVLAAVTNNGDVNAARAGRRKDSPEQPVRAPCPSRAHWSRCSAASACCSAGGVGGRDFLEKIFPRFLTGSWKRIAG